jgi:hypothetical protein
MIVDTAMCDEDIINNPDLPEIISSIQEKMQDIANKLCAEYIAEPPQVIIPAEININYTGTYALTNKKENKIVIYAIKKSNGCYYSQDYLFILDALAHELSHYIFSMRHDNRWKVNYLIIKQKIGALLL